MNWIGSGFIPVLLYGVGSIAREDAFALLTESSIEILTENSDAILVESA
jgi:hypothetical protein